MPGRGEIGDAVRPSVHLSVTNRYRVKTNVRRITRFTAPSSPESLIFCDQLSYHRSQGNHVARASNETGV